MRVSPGVVDTPRMPVAELRSVSLRIGRTPILDSVDLVLEAGERLGVSGPNGAGKTTILGILATLTTPTSGHATVLGAEVGSDEMFPIRPRIGWSGHQPALYEELTLEENLVHIARLTGIPSAEASECLAAVGLADAAGRRTEACSNGMRRRTDLARLLMTRPSLVLLDEAHAGLDAASEMIIDEIARRALAAGGAVVMVSHDGSRLGSHTDRIVTVAEGRVTA